VLNKEIKSLSECTTMLKKERVLASKN
jgi:hypothetical protein